MQCRVPCTTLFFFNDTATTEIYTLSLHDALPICGRPHAGGGGDGVQCGPRRRHRSEEHTSELQSLRHLVCRLLLEKKKQCTLERLCTCLIQHRARKSKSLTSS